MTTAIQPPAKQEHAPQPKAKEEAPQSMPVPKVNCIFEINNRGACGSIQTIAGSGGRRYKFLDKRNGRGFQFDFEGTFAEYELVMKDLLDRRRHQLQVWIYLPAIAPVGAAALSADAEAVIGDLEEKLEHALVENSDLREQLGEARSALAMQGLIEGAEPQVAAPEAAPAAPEVIQAKQEPEPQAEQLSAVPFPLERRPASDNALSQLGALLAAEKAAQVAPAPAPQVEPAPAPTPEPEAIAPAAAAAEIPEAEAEEGGDEIRIPIDPEAAAPKAEKPEKPKSAKKK